MDSTVQIKNNLISRIKNSNDLNFLKAMQTIFDSAEQELFKLNEFHKKSIEISRAEIKNGEFVKNSRVISETKNWLKKR